MTIYIYQLRDPRDQSIRYVGKTNNLRIRKNSHKYVRGRSRCDAWKRELGDLGLHPAFEVIEECSIDAWREREQYWIDRRKAEGCTLTNGALAGAGPMPGNTVSDYARQLARERYTGRPIPPEQRAQISASLTGKRQSPETMAKRRATINANLVAKGLEPWNFGRDPEVQHQRERAYYQRRARAAGKPIRYSPEWVQKRLDSFNRTLASMTPEERAKRAAHLNENPIRYWQGKKRGPHSPEVREKIRKSNIATRQRQREERTA